MNTIRKSNTYLNWMTDECFFSICSRQHIFWGNSYSHETLESLFERDVGSYNHDFPRNLDGLNDIALAVWGSAEEIIDQHTIAPMFFPFQSIEHVIAHKEAMRGNNLGPIKYKLGIITGRFGGEHPLKACSKCIVDDRTSCGVAYWHLSHQFPGVTICQKHNCLLKESKENRQWSKAFSLCIPSEENLIEAAQAALDDDTLVTLKTVSDTATKLGEMGGKMRFEPELVAQAYDTELACRGTNRQDKEASAQAFANHCWKLRNHPQFKSLPHTEMCALAFTLKMTRKPRGYCHPLKHLVLISWLFGSIEAFVGAYEHQAKQREKIKIGKFTQADLPQAQQHVRPEVPIHKPSFKPKKMFESVKKMVLESLERGTSKGDVCAEFGISISTVNRILRSNPVTQGKIIETLEFETREDHRKQWSLTISRNPSFSVKQVRRLLPNIYAWLYRNDKIWLSAQTLSLPRHTSGNNSNIDWDERDENLCTRIKEALKMRDCGTTALRKYELYQLVPGLYTALESRPHYRKTRALLVQVTQPDFHGHS